LPPNHAVEPDVLAALPNEKEAVLGWQLKRDGTRRGIVEVIEA